MKLKTFLFFVTLYAAIPWNLAAQTVAGTVSGTMDGKVVPLGYSSVYWAEGQGGVAADDQGNFELQAPESYPAKLVISFIGHKNDTIALSAPPIQPIVVELKEAADLKAVEIVQRTKATSISSLNPILVESITSKELEKAACCNLSESFETNASVDVSFTDAVSGAKKIRLLGLDGIYTSILFESMPYIRGLSSTYGLSYVPGTWIESIQVSKGAGSVANGYESMTGQINLELIKPDLTEDRLYVNLYGNLWGRVEANVQASQKMGEKWSSMLFAHGSTMQQKLDGNGDNFLDNPLKEHVQLFNRWKYKGEKYRAQFGARVMAENIQGGQEQFDYDSDFAAASAYGVGIEVRQAEVFAKNGIILNGENQSIGIITNARIHDQNSYFGSREYQGQQRSLYGNVIYQQNLFGPNLIRTGVSYVLEDYVESFNDSSFTRFESVPGAFVEYNYNFSPRTSFIGGLRGDYHNLYGWQANPRVHFKHNLKEESILRISGGRGFRVANVFAENSSVFASSRRVMVLENLEPEIAWNGGVSLTHEFFLLGKSATFNADYFRTEFENQVVVDLEDSRTVAFYNLDGSSYANSAQAEVGVELAPGLNAKTAFKWQEVRTTYAQQLKQKPLVPKHRALANVGYTTKSDKWKFDATLQWTGLSRIPGTEFKVPENRVSTQSESFYQLHAQVTHTFRNWEVYLGGENLTNYRQSNPIIAADDPFGADFDASMIWGPIAGRNVYTGIRFKI